MDTIGQLVYIKTKVKRVWEEFEKKYVSGMGPDAIFTEISKGWFVAFEGSYEALFFGHVEPNFKVGDKVKIRIEHDES